MDRTSSFLSIVDVAKKREESVDRILSSASNVEKYSAKNCAVSNKNGTGIKNKLWAAKNLFRISTDKDSDDGSDTTEKTFASQTRNLLSSITELRDFIQDYRQSYLAKYSSVAGPSSAVLAESEKIKVEQNAEQLVTLCNGLLTNIREIFLPKHCHRDASWSQFYDNQYYLIQTESEHASWLGLAQKREHEKQVLVMLDIYLREVCNSYAQLKAVRVKSNLERKQWGRLEKVAELVMTVSTLKSCNRDRNDSLCENSSLSLSSTVHPPCSRGDEGIAQMGDHQQHIESQNIPKVEDDVPFTDEDLQQLELENQQLLNDLQWMDEQTSTIEGQIVEISRLQNIFTNKVLAQTEQIDNIHMTAVSSTENVKHGNEQVRDAIRNNAGLRFWVLFFLVVSSFSLIFLDWYDT